MINKFDDFLFNRLPSIYKYRDANISPNTPRNNPLRRFMKVLAEGGFNEIIKDINNTSRALDIDTCPKEFLPFKAEQRGLIFPYSVNEATQRRYLKILPLLYRMKGTSASFNYLGREIYGIEAKVNTSTRTVHKGDLSYQEICLIVSVDGETFKLSDKHKHFISFAENLRPVNTKLKTNLVLYYSDIYPREEKLNLEESSIIRIDDGIETYNTGYTIDGKDPFKSKNHNILGVTPNTFFLLGKSHLYNNEIIKFGTIIESNDIAHISAIDEDVIKVSPVISHLATINTLNTDKRTQKNLDEGNVVKGIVHLVDTDGRIKQFKEETKSRITSMYVDKAKFNFQDDFTKNIIKQSDTEDFDIEVKDSNSKGSLRALDIDVRENRLSYESSSELRLVSPATMLNDEAITLNNNFILNNFIPARSSFNY